MFNESRSFRWKDWAGCMGYRIMLKNYIVGFGCKGGDVLEKELNKYLWKLKVCSE